jgi:hypothetical protein
MCMRYRRRCDFNHYQGDMVRGISKACARQGGTWSVPPPGRPRDHQSIRWSVLSLMGTVSSWRRNRLRDATGHDQRARAVAVVHEQALPAEGGSSRSDE